MFKIFETFTVMLLNVHLFAIITYLGPHGGSGSWTTFTPIIPQFTEGGKSILYDLLIGFDGELDWHVQMLRTLTNCLHFASQVLPKRVKIDSFGIAFDSE